MPGASSAAPSKQSGQWCSKHLIRLLSPCLKTWWSARRIKSPESQQSSQRRAQACSSQSGLHSPPAWPPASRSGSFGCSHLTYSSSSPYSLLLGLLSHQVTFLLDFMSAQDSLILQSPLKRSVALLTQKKSHFHYSLKLLHFVFQSLSSLFLLSSLHSSGSASAWTLIVSY